MVKKMKRNESSDEEYWIADVKLQVSRERGGRSVEELGGPHFQAQSKRLMIENTVTSTFIGKGKALSQGKNQISLKQEIEENLKINSEELGLQGLLLA